MKAKDKAKELVDRFLSIEGADDCGNSYSCVAKQCALICVDEIMESFNPLEYYPEDLRDYWQEVIQEINKL
jgi:hypothetical protein